MDQIQITTLRFPEKVFEVYQKIMFLFLKDFLLFNFLKLIVFSFYSSQSGSLTDVWGQRKTKFTFPRYVFPEKVCPVYQKILIPKDFALLNFLNLLVFSFYLFQSGTLIELFEVKDRPNSHSHVTFSQKKFVKFNKWSFFQKILPFWIFLNC